MGGMRANILTRKTIALYTMFSIQPKGGQRKGIKRHIAMQNSASERKMLIKGHTATLEMIPIGVMVPKKAAVTGVVAAWAPIEAQSGLLKAGGILRVKNFSISGVIAMIPASAEYESMKATDLASSGMITM